MKNDANFRPYFKGIFAIAQSSEVSELVEDKAYEIARVAQSTVRKTKKRSQWHIVRWRVRDGQEHTFRIMTDIGQKSGRRRAAILVGSPDPIGRRDGRIALAKAAKFGSVEAIAEYKEVSKRKRQSRKAVKSVKRYDEYFRASRGKDFISL